MEYIFTLLFLYSVWANHGDDISTQYSGTPALKGDFVRYTPTLFSFLFSSIFISINCTVFNVTLSLIMLIFGMWFFFFIIFILNRSMWFGWRFGQRTIQGILKDGYNALLRYYLNNFVDGTKQVGIHFHLYFELWTLTQLFDDVHFIIIWLVSLLSYKWPP